MKICKCPKCGYRQELFDKKVNELVNFNSVKRFDCDSCGFSTQVVAEKQHDGRVVLFFAMSEIEEENS